jgi:hypothetical protein
MKTDEDFGIGDLVVVKEQIYIGWTGDVVGLCSGYVRVNLTMDGFGQPNHYVVEFPPQFLLIVLGPKWPRVSP